MKFYNENIFSFYKLIKWKFRKNPIRNEMWSLNKLATTNTKVLNNILNRCFVWNMLFKELATSLFYHIRPFIEV